jgi:hypothetical protein
MYNMQNVFFSYFRTLLLFVRIHILTVPRWKWTCFFPAKQYIYNTYLSKWSFMSLLSTTILGSLLRLIALQNRSQLLYPSDSFVGIIENCEYSTKTIRYHFSFKIQSFPVQTIKLQYAMLLLKWLRKQSLVIFV